MSEVAVEAILAFLTLDPATRANGDTIKKFDLMKVQSMFFIELVFHVLQGFWFRFLVDSKVLEMKKNRMAEKN